MVTLIKIENDLLPGITAQLFPIFLDNGKWGTFFAQEMKEKKRHRTK